MALSLAKYLYWCDQCKDYVHPIYEVDRIYSPPQCLVHFTRVWAEPIKKLDLTLGPAGKASDSEPPGKKSATRHSISNKELIKWD